jgi:hypothetical protein
LSSKPGKSRIPITSNISTLYVVESIKIAEWMAGKRKEGKAAAGERSKTEVTISSMGWAGEKARAHFYQ